MLKNNPKIQTPYMVNGICSQSKYPGKAFKLLSLVMTDKTLNDLLTYGIEGEDYTLSSDGFARDSYSPIIQDMFISMPIATPNSFRLHMKLDYEQYLDTVREATVRESLGFAFDARSFEALNSDISKVLVKMSKEAFTSHEVPFEELIEKYRFELNDIGIQTAIDEANRQYALYIAEVNR